MTNSELKKITKAIEETKKAIAFEFDKCISKIDSVALTNIEFKKEEVDLSKPPF